MRRAIWVTGLGVTCAVGRDVPSFWAALLSGASGATRLTRFDPGNLRSSLVAEAGEFADGPPNRVDGLALAAAAEALDMAGLTALPEEGGIAMGGGVGGLPESEEALDRYRRSGRLAPNLRGFLGHIPAHTADVLAAAFGGHGPRVTISNACSSSTAALAQAALWIEEGEADCVLAGASDVLSRLTVGGFNCLRLVSETAVRPFDRGRNGMMVGEGAAFLLLESEERAVARAARPLAVLRGFGLSVDAHHPTAPEPRGRGALQAMARALERAGLTPAEVDHVSAHGTGTPSNDRAEARAIADLLGERRLAVPVVSIKGAVGHCLGAAGAIEAVASVLALVYQTVPPCAGLMDQDPEAELYIPREALPMELRNVLSVNLAFGGNNAAVLFGRAT
ncbi:MAG: beta-ketoacyl-[acyl-carrier-protein] synthase family protein [Acidobacteriota bacterium]